MRNIAAHKKVRRIKPLRTLRLPYPGPGSFQGEVNTGINIDAYKGANLLL
jgi:hypothetical protein